MLLVKNIKEIIYDEIRRRPYHAGEKLPGVRELAKNHGVSYVTMANALAMLAQEGIIRQFPGKGSFVTDIASKNSLALFIPDYLLGLRCFNPAIDSTCVFGLMDIYAGLLAAANKEKFHLHIIPVLEGQQNIEKNYELITQKLNAAGAFFMALSSDNLIERFSKMDFPCCKLHTPGESRYNFVSVDIERGVFKVVEHLIKLGHKRIAMISGGDMDNIWFRGRLLGYRKALKKYNITNFPELTEIIPTGNPSNELLKKTVSKFFSMREKPTAIFVTSDLWALRVIMILQEMGINVPGDISIAGFDDYVESKVFDPPVTTVAQPFYEIGERAFILMKRLLLEPSERINYVIDPNLIIRKSTARPANSKIKKIELAEACI